MVGDAVYVPCRTRGTGPTAWCELAAHDLAELDPGGRSLGCYNPRRVAGAPNTWSLHACGRALDWRPTSLARGREIARWIAWFGHTDIQLIIFDGQQWGGRLGRGWREFPGVNKHVDHIHIESRVAVPRVHITTGQPTGV